MNFAFFFASNRAVALVWTVILAAAVTLNVVVARRRGVRVAWDVLVFTCSVAVILFFVVPLAVLTVGCALAGACL